MVAAISAVSSVPALDITIYPAGPGFTGARPAVLVLPGGGFRVHAEHEGEGYGRWLSGIGVHAFVLRYRLLPQRFPAPLQDARAGLAHIRRGEHGLPNALTWAQALADAGAAVELHVYPRGSYGLGLADGVRYGAYGGTHIPHTAQWSAACEAWLREQGIL